MAAKKKTTKKKNDPAKGEPPVRIERFSQQLTCALKREEIEERAQRAAHLLSDRDSKEAAFDEEKKTMKNELNKLDLQVRELSKEVREKVTMRDVNCERRFVYSEKVVRDVRLDTGETVFERPMTDTELQTAFDFDKKGDGSGGSDVDDEFGGDDGNDDESNDDEAAE